MRARAGTSELDAGLRFHAGGEMMLHQSHLGHEIGRSDELGLCITAGDHDVQSRAPRIQGGDDGVQVEILVAQRDVELVEDHQAEAGIGHELERLRPGALGRRNVALEVLRLPGEAFPHRVPGHLLAESGQRVALRRVPGALDELHHADPMPAAEHAQGEAERGGGLALAGAGVDDEQPFLDRLSRNLGVLHGLALRHLGTMALGFGFIDRLAHGLPFTTSGSPATTSTTRSARAASRWFRRPCASRNRRASALSGTIPYPTSLETSTTAPVRRASASSTRVISASTSASASMRFVSQRVTQSTRSGTCAAAASSAPARSCGTSIVCQPALRRARCAAMRCAISWSLAYPVAR